MSTAQADPHAPQHAAIEVDGHDLPVFCPGPKSPLWSMHPRVYLDVTHGEPAHCPYCGATYRLKPGVVLHGH